MGNHEREIRHPGLKGRAAIEAILRHSDIKESLVNKIGSSRFLGFVPFPAGAWVA